MTEEQNNIAQLILSLVGALAWTPIIINKFFTKPKLDGKIITEMNQEGAMTFNPEEGAQNGIMYFLKLSLISLHKDFNLKDVSVKLKYPNDINLYDGRMYWAYSLEFHFNGSLRYCKAPSNQALIFQKQLPKNSPINTYVTFLVAYDNTQSPEYYIFEFKDHTNKLLKLKMVPPIRDVNLLDDTIWSRTPIEP